MGKLIIVLGGARSGKSTFAMELAGTGRKVAYIATAAIADDLEMKQRIEEHKKIRPSHWLTVEEPFNVDKSLLGLEKEVEVVIIDCITLLLTNWLLEGATKIEDLAAEDYPDKEKSIFEKTKNLAQTVKRTKLTVIMVSNEVGMGIVPVNRLARFFRDIAGWANRILAGAADEVYSMTAGIPLKIKG